jgi:putative ABC transport system permease protein
MNSLTIPLRAVLRRPVRSVLTIFGIAISIAGFISLTGLTRGVQVSLRTGLSESGADLMISQPNAFTLSSSSLPAELGAVLRQNHDVDEVAGALFNVVTIDDTANVVSIGWSDGSFLWRSIQLKDGRLPAADEQHVVVLGESIADALKKRTGDIVELYFQAFRIVGIAHSTSVLNQNVVLMRLTELQSLLHRPDVVTFYQIKLKRPLTQETLRAARESLLRAAPDLSVYETEQIAGNLKLVRLVQAIASTISTVVLGMAMLAVANTLLMAVNERRYDIGILSAIGWSRTRIMFGTLLEGLILATSGAAAGVLLGMGAMILAARSPAAAGLLQAYTDPVILAEAALSALIVGACGALYPAWRATTLSPSKSLRQI